eukprot:CAMPEP_0119122288 /NCGR_PEP_ID=MMETSP1310-20130426/2591_1 /TAXON_ID=464262 /ORGANISM="Genus nov. species nov., Strain RCC2339" /LENGTH=478 /DNA_ID=CAMNT_0007111927 /DNA_START=121 /DNA_END=1554 /DNA_ORIENTATION=+
MNTVGILVLLVGVCIATEEFGEDVTEQHFKRMATMLGVEEGGEATKALWYTTTAMIPMRDGVELYTVIYLPAAPDGVTTFPIVLDRTPYGADATAGLVGALYLPQGYGIAAQDMRGRYKSQGEWSFWSKSADDSFDTIAWLSAQSYSSGDVFGFGISADGNAASTEEVSMPPPPALKGQFIIVGSGQLYMSMYPGGLYRQSMIAGWSTSILEKGYIATVKENEQYGPYWYPTDLSRNWTNTNVPAVHFGGWYDIFAKGTVDNFNGYQYEGGPGARGAQYLVMNPGGHCPGGEYLFPSNSNTNLPFLFANKLFRAISEGGDPTALRFKNINVYIMGPDPGPVLSAAGPRGNFWICTNDWPAKTTRTLYLRAGGKLSDRDPRGGEREFSAYKYDPRLPVPTTGGNNLLLPTCGPWDQHAIERRYDVLTFSTGALVRSVSIVGNVQLTLYVRSSANDTEFMAKLVDVYPDGRSYNILDQGV